ncbi:hypothetical protein APHAL10511_007037 [Amanita phalloides]|nr:hypothetical protein APHAL10511_007037 [Amanita phalloides]
MDRSLTDSFDAISCSDTDLSDDDEVVWELSSFASLVADDSADDDEDFVLLTKPHSASSRRTAAAEPPSAVETLPQSPVPPLAPALRAASATPIPPATASSNAAPARPATPNVPPAPAEDAEQAKKERKRAARKRRRQRKKLRKQQAGKQASGKCKLTGANVSEMYKEASLFISTFLATPVAKRDSVCRLVLLQSLIVELGLTPCEPSEFPTTIRAARKFVKARVFLNVKEYIAHREEGQAALQRLLHPSKTALIKDIRRKGNRAPLQWVKEQGLDVLLVSCYHH